MSKPEITIDNQIKFLGNFLNKTLKSFAKKDLSKLSVEQVGIVMAMPHNLANLAKVMSEIRRSASSLEMVIDEVEKLEKKQKIDKQLELVTQEIFIAACASEVKMEEVLKFQKESGLDDKFLNEFNENELNPLAAALAGGRDVDELQQLIDAGADVNFKSPQGNNSAHFAVMFGVNKEALGVLIDNGVDVNTKNNLGLTPLDIALIRGEELGEESELIDVLSKAGAKPASLLADSKDNDKSLASTAKAESKKGLAREDDEKRAENKKSSLSRGLDEELKTLKSHEFNSKKHAALKCLEGSGINIDENEDVRTILNKALLNAASNNQTMATLFLIESGAEVTKEVTHAAINTKNMNLITTVISHADSSLITGEAKVYAAKVYPPAAELIDIAEHHSLITANTIKVNEAADHHNHQASVVEGQQAFGNSELPKEKEAKEQEAAKKEQQDRQNEYQENQEKAKQEQEAEKKEQQEEKDNANGDSSEDESLFGALSDLVEAAFNAIDALGDLINGDEEKENEQGDEIDLDDFIGEEEYPENTEPTPRENSDAKEEGSDLMPQEKNQEKETPPQTLAEKLAAIINDIVGGDKPNDKSNGQEEATNQAKPREGRGL